MFKFKYLILIFIFAFSLLKAQTHRFIYEYKFVPDSTKVDSVITENTRLEIFKDHSEFLSDLTAKRDSAITYAGETNQSTSKVSLPEGNYKNKTFKSNSKIYTIEFIGIQPFKVIRETKLKWKLLNETKKIQNYNCQKAILSYGGRQWIAWFTQEIPIQNGPSVFGDLPGLIVKLDDVDNHHSFLLVANYKTSNTKTNLIDRRYFVPVEVQEKQFNKKWNVFRENPIGATEQFMLMNPGLLSGKRFDTNGNEVDMREQKKAEQKYTEKQLLLNNNFLDLELYK